MMQDPTQELQALRARRQALALDVLADPALATELDTVEARLAALERPGERQALAAREAAARAERERREVERAERERLQGERAAQQAAFERAKADAERAGQALGAVIQRGLAAALELDRLDALLRGDTPPPMTSCRHAAEHQFADITRRGAIAGGLKRC